jgi:hypothetical protein
MSYRVGVGGVIDRLWAIGIITKTDHGKLDRHGDTICEELMYRRYGFTFQPNGNADNTLLRVVLDGGLSPVINVRFVERSKSQINEKRILGYQQCNSADTMLGAWKGLSHETRWTHAR